LRKRFERASDTALRGGASVLARVIKPVNRASVANLTSARPGLQPPNGLVAATAHWSAPHRLPFLAEFVAGVSRQDAPFSVAIYVNGPRRSDEFADDLRRLLDGKADVSVRVVAESQLVDAVLPLERVVALVDCRLGGNPYRLTWQHKRLFRQLTVDRGAFDHVGALVYTEDDMALAPMSLNYWRTYRPPLAELGLIPGFLRVEGPPDDMRVAGWPRAIDRHAPIRLAAPEGVAEDGMLSFVAMTNPYQAMYILDESLAKVHFRASPFRSRAWSKLADSHGATLGVPERAATGPLFDPPLPPGYRSRAVVPLVPRSDGSALPYAPATVDHASRNFYDDPSIPLSKQRVDEAFRLPV
jgi:hypothetical protein